MQRFNWFSGPPGVWSERSALNYIIDGAEAEIGALDARVTSQMQAMARELLVMRKVVEVLYHTLRETTDAAALDARIQAAIDELTPKPKPPSPQGNPTVTCVRCKGEFDPTQTVVMPDGTMCDACASR